MRLSLSSISPCGAIPASLPVVGATRAFDFHPVVWFATEYAAENSGLASLVAHLQQKFLSVGRKSVVLFDELSPDG